MSTSTVVYRFEHNLSIVKDGEKHVVRKNIIDGQKGLSFHFLEKKGEKKFYKITVKELESGEFEVKEKKNDGDESKKNMSEKDMMKLLEDKNLSFVKDYVTKERKKYNKAKAKRSRRKSSKKKATKKKASKKKASKKKKTSKKKASKKRKSSKKKASKKRKSTKKKASKKKSSRKSKSRK